MASIFTPYVLNMQKDKHPPPQTSKKKEKVFLFVKNESYNVTGHSATPTAKALVKMLEETDTKVSTVYPQVNKSCIDIYWKVTWKKEASFPKPPYKSRATVGTYMWRERSCFLENVATSLKIGLTRQQMKVFSRLRRLQTTTQARAGLVSPILIVVV